MPATLRQRKIYEFFVKKDDLRVPYGRGEKSDSKKSVDVRSKERFMSNSFLPQKNKLKAVKENKVNDKPSVKENKVNDRPSVKEYAKHVWSSTLPRPERFSGMDPTHPRSCLELMENKDKALVVTKKRYKASVKVYTRRIGEEVFWDKKLKRHPKFKEFEMDPEFRRELRKYKSFREYAESLWDSFELEHPATFDELGMDPKNKGIISNFFAFVRDKEFCKRMGWAWRMPNWLVYDSPGTKKSLSIVAAMANYLKYDIYHLDLTSFSSFDELKNMLLSTRKRSVITVEGLYHCAGMLLNLKTDEYAVKNLLNKIDALFLRYNNERIFVFTTNHRDHHDAASLRPLKMDIYIHTSLPQPIALPDGEKRTYHNNLLVSDSTKRYSLPNFDAIENNAVKVYSRRGRDCSHSMELEQPPTLAELGNDPDKEGIISDLLSFVRDKELYKRIGKTWRRGYLLYDSPGTDRSSLIGAMANYLKFDIYDFDVTGLSSITELKKVVANRNRSLIAIKNSDPWFGMPPDIKNEVLSLRKENEFMVSFLSEYVDMLLSSCGDELIIVLTANHMDPHAAALLLPVDMDTYIQNSSTQPVALPDEGETVQLDSSEQKPLVNFDAASPDEDLYPVECKKKFDATNNGACQSGLIVSNSEMKNTREALKGRCMMESVLGLVDSKAGISSTDFDDADNRAYLVSAHHSTSPMGLKQPATFVELATDTENEGIISDLLRFVRDKEYYQSIGKAWKRGYLLYNPPGTDRSSLMAAMANHLEFDIYDLDLTGLSSISELTNVLVYFRSRSLVAIKDFDHWFGMLSNLKNELTGSYSLEFADGLLSSCGDEQIIVFTTNNKDLHDAALRRPFNKDMFIHKSSTQPEALQDEGEIVDKGEILVQLDLFEQKPLVDFDATNNKAHQSGILVPNLEKESMRETSDIRCMTESVFSLVDSTTIISSTDFGAPDNIAHLLRAHETGPIAFISEKKDTTDKKETRVGLGRECLTECVFSLDDSTKHKPSLDFYTTKNKAHMIGARRQKFVTRICMKHGINRVSSVNCIHKPHGIHWWPFRQKWARRKGYSLGGERTFEVSSVSMDDILDSRLLFIHMPQFSRSSPQTSALPDGGKIFGPVALSSTELAATNNRAHDVRQDQNGYTASLYACESTRVTSGRRGIPMSSCSVKDLQQHFCCKHKDVMKRLGVNRPMFKSTCRQHQIYWQPCRLKNNERKAFDAHLVEADQSGPTVSNLEKETMREASKRKCITKSVPFSEDLRQHYGGGQRDAAKSLYDSLVWNSVEVLDILPLWEESNTIEHLVQRRRLVLQQRWIRPKKSLDLPRTLQMNCIGGLTVQSAGSLNWPIGLPAGGHVVSLSKRIIVRKTFKRECRTISVSFEGHQHHFGSRCEGVAYSPCVNRICQQHGISLVPTVKRIHRQHGIHRLPFRQGNSSGRERPVEVISVSTEEKLISRLQFLRMSLVGRSSLCPLALPSGSEFPGHIAFSSSESTSTNNRAYPGRQDQYGSSASHIEKERTRETLYGEGTASHVFSFEHVQQHFGSKRKNDAKILGVCLSNFKRITRHHGIRRWPNQIRKNVWRSPDPHREKNLSPTFKTLTTNCPITMENDMGCQNLEPDELRPDSFEDLNFRNGENGSLAEIEKTPTFHDSFSGNCSEADICLSEYDKTQAARGSFKWAFQLKGLTTQFTANPNLNTLVFPHPQIASTEVLSENMGNSENGTKLLASQAEGFLEGDASESSNLTFPLESMQATACPNHNTLQLPQPLIALTQILNENMGSSEDWIASQQEPFLEGHVSGSINFTVHTCSGPSPSQQPMPTTPYTMHRVLHMLPPLTSSLDASSVKMKATYRDTIIEFQLPLASGSIELKEEVAKILKLEIDSFNVRYKDEEGEGDWILIPCDKYLRNYLQLFSSLVNPVIRLLVVDKDANLMNLNPMALKQPATLVESGIDPDSNGIVSDLLRFVSEKEICKKAGKAWMRFYLLYEPPGADRSSLITDMANYLEFDICYLDLRSMSSIPELKNMLLSTPNRSLIAIQDIDHCAVMLPNLKNELTVSCLLKYVDGLFSRCGDERIIVFTTNHRDRNDAALLPLVNMDIYIPASSPQPIALPDGGEIVQLDSSEQKPLVDFDATNNRECHSGILVSSSKNNNKREASKRLCMTESVLSVIYPTTGISLMEFDAPNNGANLVRACQGGSIMSNSEKKDTGEGLKRDFLTKSVLSLDDSTKQKSLPDCDATENEAHLLISYQSCPVVSLLENRNRGEALKRECITKSILGLEYLQQHSGGRRDNAAKSFAAIYDPGIHTTNSLARKSFEVVETLRSSEQLSNATDTEREREIWTQMCLKQSDARGAHSIHVNTYARRFRARLFLSFCHSVCVRSIFWEPDDFVPTLSLRRLTLKGCVRKQKSPHLPRLLQIIAVEPRPTKSPRCSGGLFAKSGTPLHWSDVLPDGGQVVSLSEKEIVRKTLKRKCRTTKVRKLEYQQLHFDSRCQDAAERHGAKRICRQHVINQVSTVKCIHRQHAIHWWPFQQKWAMMKVYSLEGQRPLEVISPSTSRKLVARLQVIHVSWLGRSSPGSSAIPGGGEILGFIALSSSGFAATNNRANLLGQNPSSSTASHSNKKRRRDAAVDKGTNLYIGEQDLRQHFGLTREEAARRLGVSVTTLKRHCRKHGILRWPCNRNGSSDIPGRPPDPDVVPPDFFDDLGACLETPISSFLEEIAASGSYEAAFLPQEQITVSFAYPTHNHPVSAQPHIASKEMASENTRSSDLTTQVEAHSEGSNYSSVPTFSNPALSQPVSTISETGPTVPQHISTIPGIGPSQLEARLEARGSGSSYLTFPTSSIPAWTQPMSTIPETGPAIPQPVSTIPVTGPTIPHIIHPLIAQQDMRLVTIKAKYSDSIVRFKLPLTSGLTELNENVAKRLNLRLDSFDVEYRDEEGLWILISCDEDLRDYMQLFCSLDTPVIKLSVLDKVVNANESSGSFKRKRPWDA